MSTPNQADSPHSPNAVTLDARISADFSASESPCGRVELVEGSGPQFSFETQCLLQRRLRAAAGILLFGFGLFLIRRLFVTTPLWGFHLAVVAILGGTIVGLSTPCQHSLKKLRVVELAIFWLPAIFLGAHQYAYMLQEARGGDATMMLAAMKSSVLYFFGIMVVYGMFIPNTWRRTVLFVAPMALVPVLVAFALRAGHREVESMAAQVATLEQMSDHILMLLIGAVIATYGTHIISTLRIEAFEAKQLGQYRLKESIGTGGMGEVYLAEHQLLKRPCAIKLIRPDKAGDPKVLRRFEREVRTTARLSHPNTIDIYDYGRTKEGVFFYVMEFLPGMDLAELVQRYGPLPPGRVIHLLDQVCGALAEAHAIGFIHRDIKPGNIFAAYRGGLYDTAKLLDFGLVKSMAGLSEPQLTQTGTFTGSPLYMSPEQTFGDDPPDARSDIYALGGVAYHLLTGRPPFEGDTPMKVLIAHARDQALAPSKVRPDVPRDLEEIVIRCLAKEPQERFHTVGALRQALLACHAAGRWTQDDAARWWNSTAQLKALVEQPDERAAAEKELGAV